MSGQIVKGHGSRVMGQKSWVKSQPYSLNSERNEACGVFGIYASGEDVARLTYFGLHGLQHRGQESAGIAVADGSSISIFKDMGLVPQVFDEQSLASLKGHIAVGHVRYSTTGSTRLENAQPIEKPYLKGTLAIAHNGNLINTQQLREMLLGEGIRLQSTSDSEVIAALVAKYAHLGIGEAIRRAMKFLRGAYSVVILTEDKLVAIRDPYGIRPLGIGKLGRYFVISSETCGLDIVGAKYLRDIEPGEMVVINEDGIHIEQAMPLAKPSLCIFEFIYFARPDSSLYGRNLYYARKSMGIRLAQEAPADADLVIGVPDTGTSAAVGFAEESGIPFGEGLIKNRYIGRTFIEPSQRMRQMGIRLKLNPLREVIKGKRLIVVDDSIVRGNTTKKIIRILKEAGATEVHMRISSPPIKYPCFYGIDTANRSELIASTKSVEEIREFIGADSLHYLSIEALVASTRRPYEDFCLACFDGVYPIRIPKDLKITKFMLEKEPSVVE
ncbi:MAG: amidophosphoribosyltransferase [Actinomycetota bacterium]|nr:amidophosphoribosyltransferase [Actinomycetota bacterium]MDI6822616.1 amidophosphoribosyltransferase [Actinomycetota bacterium]